MTHSSVILFIPAAALAVHRLAILPAGPPPAPGVPLVGLLVLHALGAPPRHRVGGQERVPPPWRRRADPARLPRATCCPGSRRAISSWTQLMMAPPPELVAADQQTAWRLRTLTPRRTSRSARPPPRSSGSSPTASSTSSSTCPPPLSVALGMSRPEFWPHLFGPLSELYTIRAHSGISASAGRSPRSPTSSPTTYTRLFLVFAISGALHHPTDVVQGLPRGLTATVAFFLMQPVGIVLEDAVQALTRGWPLPRAVRSVAGYAWVVFFLVCKTPTWTFSVARLGQTPDLLPIPVARPLVAMLTGE
ncbi:hypothetical protein ISF_01543 [Cordyceps fumosorosea ARSEF 2679]|uniref:Wax synthase domain-containing protein n=1 Tax=Cordyceps fumosorosea (strain ARSEF 2679) TaxID=1081104 RepID=A0A168DDC8_CORFA|nr:hypothetical protein ISF_01543 [Cordyceps fumosorosea ARSEF 2679]OAA72470.1 hypothetical protein ISF_01543 [Cordyceps fumosorosea ARSEF 2679]